MRTKEHLEESMSRFNIGTGKENFHKPNKNMKKFIHIASSI